jgi:hypothetical protein
MKEMGGRTNEDRQIGGEALDCLPLSSQSGLAIWHCQIANRNGQYTLKSDDTALNL